MSVSLIQRLPLRLPLQENKRILQKIMSKQLFIKFHFFLILNYDCSLYITLTEPVFSLDAYSNIALYLRYLYALKLAADTTVSSKFPLSTILTLKKCHLYLPTGLLNIFLKCWIDSMPSSLSFILTSMSGKREVVALNLKGHH